MMKKLLLPFAFSGVVLLSFYSCKKIEDLSAREIPNFDASVTSGTLKDAADFPVGVGIGYNLFKNNTTYANLVKSEFHPHGSE